MAEDNSAKVLEQQLTGYAFRVLGRRDYSRQELKQKLLQNYKLRAHKGGGYSSGWGRRAGAWSQSGSTAGATVEAEELVESILDYLQEQGFQDDAKFAAAYVRQAVNKGWGPIKITQKLREKGVTPAIASTQLDSYATAAVAAADSDSLTSGTADSDSAGFAGAADTSSSANPVAPADSSAAADTFSSANLAAAPADSSTDAAAVLDPTAIEDFWLTKAQELAARKYSLPFVDVKQKSQCYRFLLSRGFSSTQAAKIINTK